MGNYRHIFCFELCLWELTDIQNIVQPLFNKFILMEKHDSMRAGQQSHPSFLSELDPRRLSFEKLNIELSILNLAKHSTKLVTSISLPKWSGLELLGRCWLLVSQLSYWSDIDCSLCFFIVSNFIASSDVLQESHIGRPLFTIFIKGIMKTIKVLMSNVGSVMARW